MTTQDPGRKHLATAMNRRRASLHTTWDEVARRGGISVATLRRVRNGNDPITIDTVIAIERGLNWDEGHVDAILTGAPTPPTSAPIPPAPPGIDPKRWKSWDDTGRQVVLDAIRIAERNRAHEQERIHPNERQRTREA